jgi:hypothetical protein
MRARLLLLLVDAALRNPDCSAELKRIALHGGASELQWENMATTLAAPPEPPPVALLDALREREPQAARTHARELTRAANEWTDDEPADSDWRDGDRIMYRDVFNPERRQYKVVPKGSGNTAEPGAYLLRLVRKEVNT